MDASRFDAFTRSIDIATPRRTALGALLGGGTAALLSRLERDAAAKKKRKRRKKRKKKAKITFNEFGCVNVGSFCKSDDQCCSGICEGTNDKKTCQAHDQSTCQAGQDGYCSGGPTLPCDTSAGRAGACSHTTGNASFCQHDASCRACRKDADCVPFCGPQSACIVADECCPSTGTACTSVELFGCGFQ